MSNQTTPRTAHPRCPICRRRPSAVGTVVASTVNDAWCCTRCANERPLVHPDIHDLFAPNCDVNWHDVWDHATFARIVNGEVA